ncbi:MAG: hypothetical protein HYZ71_08215 [Deltaproteobacteria bacterium]|nr:hypothetical protein [Deltaproteobacteria bacterium]
MPISRTIAMLAIASAVSAFAAGPAPKAGFQSRPAIQLWLPDPVDVDFLNSSANGKKKSSGDDANAIKLLNASGAKKTSDAGSPKLKIETDENAKRDNASPESPPNNGDGQPPPRQQTLADSASGAQAFPKWYPLCLFIDESVSQGDGNSAVKGVTDAGAECGVNVVVFPVTVRGEPDDYKIVNDKSVEMCNLSEIGASVGSASVCVPYRQLADKMCDSYVTGQDGVRRPTENVAGCAAVRSGQESQIKSHWNTHYGKGSTPDEAGEGKNGGGGTGVLASIEDQGSCDKFTVNHESVGHSGLGWPNMQSRNAGFGIEDVGGSGGSGDRWSGNACARLQEVAMSNDGRYKYDKKKQVYYTPAKEPLDFMAGTKLFGPPNPPPTSPPKIAVNTGAPTQEVFSSNFFDNKKSPSDSPLVPPGDTSNPERHKKNSSASTTTDEGSGGKEIAGRSGSLTDPKVASQFPTPPTSKGKADTSSLTMDEGASKNPGSSGNADDSGKSGDATDSRMGRTDPNPSITFDESAREGGSLIQTSVQSRGTALRKSTRKGDVLDPSFFRRKPATEKEPSPREKGSGLRPPGVKK